uniref:Uncharacterized protein n=1 Tax=Arundo donax TaxID=35708 RepID=A0A0A9GFF6_ARUDO
MRSNTLDFFSPEQRRWSACVLTAAAASSCREAAAAVAVPGFSFRYSE